MFCIPEPERNARIIELMRKQTEEMVAAGPEACRQYLIKLGIHNEDGTLTQEFGGDYTGEKP